MEVPIATPLFKPKGLSGFDITHVLIEDKQIKKSHNDSRICFPYKKLFFKLEYSLDNFLPQNKHEFEFSSKIDPEDIMYFTQSVGYHEGETTINNKKVFYSFHVQKQETFVPKPVCLIELEKNRDIIRKLTEKYQLEDIGFSDFWNWSFKEHEGQIIPVIYDMGM